MNRRHFQLHFLCRCLRVNALGTVRSVLIVFAFLIKEVEVHLNSYSSRNKQTRFNFDFRGAVNKVVESFRSLMVEDQVVVGKQPGPPAAKSKTGSGGRQTGPSSNVVRFVVIL